MRRAKPPRQLSLPALPFLSERPARRVQDDLTHAATVVPNREAFDSLAIREDVPGALGVREVKFIILDADTDSPTLYFMNTNAHPLHYYFVKDHLGVDISIADFNRVTYFTSQRRYIAGSIVAYDSYSLPDASPGLYAIEFWPTDPIGAQYVTISYKMIKNAMPFAAQTLAYHPSGDLQEQQFSRDADAYAAQSVRTTSSHELFENISYSPLNLGEAIGTLRIVQPTDRRPPSPTDIVIYETLPNDLPLVAGVISAAPQTPLSHVNLRARQNGVPNAYVRQATEQPHFKQFLNKTVSLKVTPDRIEIRSATVLEANAAFAARRPRYVQFPLRNLDPQQIRPLEDLLWTDMHAFGSKATNVAELRRVIEPELVPNGFAVPFSFYDSFMKANDFYEQATDLMETAEFADEGQRPDILKAFRRKIKDAPVPESLRDQLDAMHKAFPVGTTPRCRSSANAEDMIGFTGAGLYNSYTHRLDEGHIEKSIKQVWSSLWTHRAYQEREFYRIDHLTSAMGVLVHPNFDDELVNGVALTRNIYFPDYEGYFINAQVGENLITNPEGAEAAEEILIIKDLNLENARPYEAIYIRRSDLVGPDETVISELDLMILIRQLKTIHDHFGKLYDRSDDKSFAMDVEFKFDKTGKLAIKQARPWVIHI